MKERMRGYPRYMASVSCPGGLFLQKLRLHFDVSLKSLWQRSKPQKGKRKKELTIILSSATPLPVPPTPGSLFLGPSSSSNIFLRNDNEVNEGAFVLISPQPPHVRTYIESNNLARGSNGAVAEEIEGAKAQPTR